MLSFFYLIIAVTFHELSHIVTAKFLGIKYISLSPKISGAVLTFDFTAVNYLSELFVHLAGGIGGMSAALVAFLLFHKNAIEFIGISVVLTLINYLPIENLDGGGILKTILLLFCSPDTVYKLCRVVSLITIILLWIFVLWIELRVSANFSVLLLVLSLMISLKNN
ncbi:MAG: hypothetical protein E7672_02195 [Ruminococcaceae bacterium]|nr:hypothetical protein [Oscillospiraceae bacterium]